MLLPELPNTWKTLCFPSTIGVYKHRFWSYMKTRRHYASRQLLELTIVALRATKILSKVGADIPIDSSFQSCQNSVSRGRWHSCGLWLSEPPKSCQQWELTFLSTVVFRATKSLSTLKLTCFQSCLKIMKTLYFLLSVWADGCNFKSYLRKRKMLGFLSGVWVDNLS